MIWINSFTIEDQSENVWDFKITCSLFSVFPRLKWDLNVYYIVKLWRWTSFWISYFTEILCQFRVLDYALAGQCISICILTGRISRSCCHYRLVWTNPRGDFLVSFCFLYRNIHLSQQQRAERTILDLDGVGRIVLVYGSLTKKAKSNSLENRSYAWPVLRPGGGGGGIPSLSPGGISPGRGREVVLQTWTKRYPRYKRTVTWGNHPAHCTTPEWMFNWGGMPLAFTQEGILDQEMFGLVCVDFLSKIQFSLT